MLRRMLVYIIIISLPIALLLYFNNVSRVQLGESVIGFIRTASQQADKFYVNWKIPDITAIPEYEEAWYDWLILPYLVKIANVLIGFVNAIASIVNGLVNTLIFLVSLVVTAVDSVTNAINYAKDPNEPWLTGAMFQLLSFS